MSLHLLWFNNLHWQKLSIIHISLVIPPTIISLNDLWIIFNSISLVCHPHNVTKTTCFFYSLMNNFDRIKRLNKRLSNTIMTICCYFTLVCTVNQKEMFRQCEEFVFHAIQMKDWTASLDDFYNFCCTILIKSFKFFCSFIYYYD